MQHASQALKPHTWQGEGWALPAATARPWVESPARTGLRQQGGGYRSERGTNQAQQQGAAAGCARCCRRDTSHRSASRGVPSHSRRRTLALVVAVRVDCVCCEDDHPQASLILNQKGLAAGRRQQDGGEGWGGLVDRIRLPYVCCRAGAAFQQGET